MYTKGSQARINHLKNLGWVYQPRNERNIWYIKYDENGRVVAKEGDKTWENDRSAYETGYEEKAV